MTVTPFRSTVPLLVPGTPEHRQQRYVSASTVAALFGQHDFLDLPTLAAIKRGEVEDTAGEAAETGNVLEDVVAQWWADQRGVTVYKPTESFVYGPLSASPDRLIVGCADTILEVKTTSTAEGAVKPMWWWQVQAQMACTGTEQAVVAVLWGGSLRLREYPIDRDDGAISEMLDAADNFLAALDLGIDPAPVGREATDETFQLGPKEADLCRELAFYRRAEADAKEQVKGLRALLDAAIGGPGMPVGSRAVLVDEAGNVLGRVRRQKGKPRMVPSGETGDDFTVFETTREAGK